MTNSCEMIPSCTGTLNMHIRLAGWKVLLLHGHLSDNDEGVIKSLNTYKEPQQSKVAVFVFEFYMPNGMAMTNADVWLAGVHGDSGGGSGS